MTRHNVEPNYRIGKRFKSRTSKNLYKALNINKLQINDANLTHH